MKNYRIFHLTLKPSIFHDHKHVYTVVSISGKTWRVQKIKTTWNKPVKFKVYEAGCDQNEVTLVVKIKAARMFVDKKLGEVRVPVKELLEGVTSEGKTMQTVSYPVKRWWSGESIGDLTFCYEFGKLVSGEARKVAVGGGTRSKSDSGLGFGTGFLGATLAVDGFGGGCGAGGGGCGGGGCGGGCGGC